MRGTMLSNNIYFSPGARRSAEIIFLLGALLIGFAVVSASAALADSKKRLGVYHLDVANDRIDVHITLNKSESVKVEYPFSEALVSNPDVADVVPLTNQSVNILAKKIGVTRLSLLD